MTLASSIIGGALSGLVASHVGDKLDLLFDDEAHFHGVPHLAVVLREKITASVREFDSLVAKKSSVTSEINS